MAAGGTGVDVKFALTAEKQLCSSETGAGLLTLIGRASCDTTTRWMMEHKLHKSFTNDCYTSVSMACNVTDYTGIQICFQVMLNR